MAKAKNVVAYSPSKSDFRHMRHCNKRGLITLGLSAIHEKPTVFNLARTDYSTTPISFHYFLIDFKKPPTPANRQEFSEKDCYVKMFVIYKEFYMRDNNITEVAIAEVAKKDIEMIEKPIVKKTEKKKKQPKDMINFPFKQIDLLDMIEECENEKDAK